MTQRNWPRVSADSLGSIKGKTMLQMAIVLLILALVAAVLGFGGIAASFAGVAKILFFCVHCAVSHQCHRWGFTRASSRLTVAILARAR